MIRKGSLAAAQHTCVARMLLLEALLAIAQRKILQVTHFRHSQKYVVVLPRIINSIKAQLGWHLAQRFKRHGIMFYFRRNASHAQIALVNIYFSLTQNRPRNFNFLRRIYKLLRALSRLLSLPPSLKRNDHFPETVGFVN
jgi:hypothetical protein